MADSEVNALTAIGSLAVGDEFHVNDSGSSNVSRRATMQMILDLTFGKQTQWIPAAAMRPTVSNGCATLVAVETTAGRPDIVVLDFDKDADEHAQFYFHFPKQWNLGTVTFQVSWVGIASTDDVDWALQGIAIADNIAFDAAAYGTPVVVTDNSQGAVKELLISAESGAVTIDGTPTDDKLCCFRIFRDVSGDAMAGDARLIGIRLFWTNDTINDS